YGLGSFQLSFIPGASVNPVTYVIYGALVIGIIALVIFCIFLARRYQEQILSYWRRWREASKRLEDATTVETIEEPSNNLCKECNERLPDNAKFCPKCGETFEE
ncbi:MAG: zinc ribbon domain-containing protein, partial [Candidatus Thorarchaeota archaeon]